MTTMLDAVAFALLGGSALGAVLCLLAWRTRRRGVFLGVSLVVFFVMLRLMAERLLPAALEASPMARGLIAAVLGALAALAAAFAIDSAIRRHVWYGTFRDGDHSKVPTILIGLFSLGGYALTCLLIASQIFGLDVTAVAATSGVMAIVLGYSAQPTLSQVFAGLALNMQRPFRLGDSVQIDGVWGVVTDANWRAVTLRTYDGNLVTLPNTLVAATKLTNLNQPTDDLRHHIPFVADIDVPPGRVRAVALAAMAAQPHVLRGPAPLVLFKDFSDRGAAYEAIFWHHDPNLYILRRDEIGHALWYAFHRAGIAIAVNRRLLAAPQDAPPPARADDPAEEQARLLGFLRGSALYAGFPDEELQALAARTRRRLFAAGESIMRQGEAGDSMFVILEGQVSVCLSDAAEAETEIYTQGPGETFGHMSALTGAPRFATVRAVGHLVLAEIDRATLAPMIAAHPDVVDRVAQQILKLETAHRRLQQERMADREGAEDTAPRLLERISEGIRAFFGARG